MESDRLATCLQLAGQVLGVTVKPTDGFFDLGGDSMKAVELVLQLHNALGVQINPYEMLTAPSLHAFFHTKLDAAAGIS